MGSENVWLQRPNSDVPWGFRLRGGRDYKEPLTVHRVTVGSIASTGLDKDDIILKIGTTETSNLTNQQSQDLIKEFGNLLQFTVFKASKYPSNNDGKNKQSYVRPSPSNYSRQDYSTQDDIYGCENTQQVQSSDPRKGYSEFSTMPRRPLQSSGERVCPPPYAQKSGTQTSNTEARDDIFTNMYRQSPLHTEVNQNKTNQYNVNPHYATTPRRDFHRQRSSPASNNTSTYDSQTMSGFSPNWHAQQKGRAQSEKEKLDSYLDMAEMTLSQACDTSTDPYNHNQPGANLNTNYKQDQRPYSPNNYNDNQNNVMFSSNIKPNQHNTGYFQNNQLNNPYNSQQQQYTDSKNESRYDRKNKTSYPNEHRQDGSRWQPSTSYKQVQSPDPYNQQDDVQARSRQTILSPTNSRYMQPQPAQQGFNSQLNNPQYDSQPSPQLTSRQRPKPTYIHDVSNQSSNVIRPSNINLNKGPTNTRTNLHGAPTDKQFSLSSPSTVDSGYHPVHSEDEGPAVQYSNNTSSVPPAPPLPQTMPTNSGRNYDSGSQNYATKLDEQLARLQSSRAPLPSYDRHPDTPPSHRQGVTSPMSSMALSPSGSAASSGERILSPPPARMMPDAVINMAAKNPTDKKPFSYADAAGIKEQSAKMKRGRARANIPRYQNALGMPDFRDQSPAIRSVPGSPVTRHHQPTYTRSVPSSPEVRKTPPFGRMTSVDSSGSGLVAHAQYNSPLAMYSDENLQEAFRGQSDGDVINVHKVASPNVEAKDYTNSPVYRAIHGPSPSSRAGNVMHKAPLTRSPKPPTAEELVFKGSNRRGDIPSRSFHRLQSMTSQDDDSPINDSYDQQANEDTASNYNEESIRYRGGSIPSRSFKLLQSMTGGPDHTDSERLGTPKRSQTPVDDLDEKDPDDIVDIRFVGKKIPSKSFKILQKSIGEPTDNNLVESPSQSPTNSRDVHANETNVLTSEEESTRSSSNRKLSLERRTGAESPSITGVEGTVARASGRSSSRNRTRENSIQRSRESSLDTRRKTRQTSDRDDSYSFDESAYLSGRLCVTGEGTLPRSRRNPREIAIDNFVEPEEKRDDAHYIKNYDEEAFLSGKISLFGDNPSSKKLPPRAPRNRTFSTPVPWEEKIAYRSIDEEAIQERRKQTVARAASQAKAPWEERKERDENFDYYERFRPPKQNIPVRSQSTIPWERKDMSNFDENSFIRRNSSGGDDPNQYVPWAEQARRKAKYSETQIRCNQSKKESQDENDRPTTPWEGNKMKTRPPKQFEKSIQNRDDQLSDRSWFNNNKEIYNAEGLSGSGCDSQSSSMEDILNGVSGNKFRMLRRTLSREDMIDDSAPRSRPSSRGCSTDTDETKEAFKKMVYVGRNIPSKSFLKLSKMIDKVHQPSKKVIRKTIKERNANQKFTAENFSDSKPPYRGEPNADKNCEQYGYKQDSEHNVENEKRSKAINSLPTHLTDDSVLSDSVESCDPEQYFEKLKRTVEMNNKDKKQHSNIKVMDVTDF